MYASRKPTEIKGVSASSVVDLKAVLAQEKQALKTGQRPTAASIRVGAAARGKFEPNPGVEDRRRRDEEAFRQENERSAEFIEQRLKEKSMLYNKFVRGEAQYDPDNLPGRKPSGHRFRDERDDIPIDFEQKHLDYVDRQRERGSGSSRGRSREDRYYRDDDDRRDDDTEDFYLGSGQFYHEDIEREEERRKWEEHMRRSAAEEADEARKRFEQRSVLNQLMADTKEGREKHQELQMKRKLAKLSRSEAIRQRAASIKEEQQQGPEQLETAEEEKDDVAEQQQKLRLKRPKLS
eukprot:TRINITY_DN13331_c0_g1_i1.p1 TRINITY_DN13331_c0_g1~~TRINITY_DN13331_c0_g1_i1.p1  ORF type:complete len:293 (-),score=67.01 TRINITY_DN13331_c0_g1_i1:144-1022(-)